MTTDLTDTDILTVLRAACAKAGSQQAWAAANGISPAFVSKVLNGREDITVRIIEALGYECLGKRYTKKR